MIVTNQDAFNDGMNLGLTLGALVAAALAGIILVLWIGCSNRQWRIEAIQHGAAHYDADSGEFEWNTTTVEAK